MKYIAFILALVVLTGCGNEPRTADEYLKSGQKAFLKKDYTKARDYLGEGLASNSSHKELLYFMGLSCQAAGLTDSAFYYIKRADLLYRHDREINLALLDVAMAAEEWQAALEAVWVLVETGDSPAKYERMAAELNVKTENWFVAFIKYRDLVAKYPDDALQYLQLADISLKVDSIQFAIELMDAAIEKFGPKMEFLQNQVVLYSAAGDAANAERKLRELLEINANPIMTKLALANLLAHTSSRAKKEEALRLYRELESSEGRGPKLDSAMRSLESELN